MFAPLYHYASPLCLLVASPYVLARFDERPSLTIGHNRFVLRTPMRIYTIEPIALEAVAAFGAHAIGLGFKVVGVLIHRTILQRCFGRR